MSNSGLEFDLSLTKINFQLETNVEDGSRETDPVKELFRDRACQ